MCGIIGIVTLDNKNIVNTVLNSLTQLQNRGYDSAGISLLDKNNNTFRINKYASTNNINSLDKLKQIEYGCLDNINIAIGHNRWATHGVKNDINAHPHISNDKLFCLVHNGIIENYSELKKFLVDKGYSFYSQTDTEVIVNLLEYNYRILKNVISSIEKTIEKLSGTYGLVIQTILEPNKLYCLRNGSPLLLGINNEYCIVTSEQSGFLNIVNSYISLHNNDICTIEIDRNKNISFKTNYNYVKRNTNVIEYLLSPEPFAHWTIKEIFEQPNTVINAINNGGRIKNSYEVKLGGLDKFQELLKTIDNLILLGCGTSYFACQYGIYHIKKLCNFNTVQVFDGADFNEYDIPKIGYTAFILVSQSGETKDLHRCIDIAKKNNIITIGIINVIDSLIAREVDCGIYCNAGKEVGVASTKSFISQSVCLSMLAIWFAQIKDINKKLREKYIYDLYNLSNDIKVTIDNVDKEVEKISNNLFEYKNMFLLGKGSDECIAKEGSLKIKEISYIHSEGYSSSSLKHGPFALLDENFPVLIINLDQNHYSKIINCYEEVISRNAPVIFITNENIIKNTIKKNVILIPQNSSYESLLGIIPIQLMAYYISIKKNINPDIPKNLAKVVTVE